MKLLEILLEVCNVMGYGTSPKIESSVALFDQLVNEIKKKLDLEVKYINDTFYDFGYRENEIVIKVLNSILDLEVKKPT